MSVDVHVNWKAVTRVTVTTKDPTAANYIDTRCYLFTISNPGLLLPRSAPLAL